MKNVYFRDIFRSFWSHNHMLSPREYIGDKGDGSSAYFSVFFMLLSDDMETQAAVADET
jgi:hypothetical protein